MKEKLAPMAWRIGKKLQSAGTGSKISDSEVTESAYLDHSHFRPVFTPEVNVLTPVCIRSSCVEEGIEISKIRLLQGKVRKNKQHLNCLMDIVNHSNTKGSFKGEECTRKRWAIILEYLSYCCFTRCWEIRNLNSTAKRC